MRSDMVPGAIFPDYELSDHTAKRRTGTSPRPNSKRRGSKAARNSSIRTARRTSKLSVNRIRSVIAIAQENEKGECETDPESGLRDVRDAGVVRRSRTGSGPEELAGTFGDGDVVDAGFPPAHQAVV